MSSSTDLNHMARWLEIEWSEDQRASFRRYQSWLVEEAIPAGGLGPREASRIFDRHIADSLAFVRLMRNDARTLVDVGSGVGLPGIPIAIARRGLHVTVVDRAERRSRLAARAVRILGLDNVTVSTGDVDDLEDQFDVITFRASLSIDPAITAFGRLAKERGEGLFAWSRTNRPIDIPAAPPGTIFTIVSEGDGVLDSPAWFLRMQRNRSR
ncbi:MAG: 16S rRNA (guanine(527)-N(7))-methyltransferase RsmG [Acidimicrobiia bacterium]